MYSLVSAPVLGFDLTRIPGGSAAAEVLLRALSLTVGDVEAIAFGRAPDAERATLWQDVAAAAQQRRDMQIRSVGVEEGTEFAGAVRLLERTPIGTVDGLLHCLRYDVLDWTWQEGKNGGKVSQSDSASKATMFLSDALAASYLRDLLPDETRRRLTAPWVAANRLLPERPMELGPHQQAVVRLLERVGGASAVQLQRLSAAAERARPTLSDWAPAVHAASWAVFLSGRVRAAAAAQLMLVQAIDRAGVPVAGRAGGVWNLLSGAVQALVVRDLLDSTNLHRLLDPYFSAIGPVTE
jgi:hypothetical protein